MIPVFHAFLTVAFRQLQVRSRGKVTSCQPSTIISTPPKGFKNFPFQYHEEVDVLIEDITNTGAGVARKNIGNESNWVIFCPLVLPGELVRVRVYKNEKSYSEADLVRVISPSEDRITPQCKYFSVCGGCQYQHMAIESQRRWKRNQVRSQLEKYATLENIEVNEVLGTDNHFFYRSKITPHYDSPTKKSPALKIGFQRRGTRDIVDIDECIIATPQINSKLSELRSQIQSSYSNEASKPARGATLLLRQCEEGVEVDNRKLITERVGNLIFKFKAGEFFQNNAYILPKLVDYVISESRGVGGDPPRFLVDAYCGSGLFSIASAHSFEKTFGVEISRLAVNAAINNAKINNITNAEFMCGEAERIFDRVRHLPRDETAVLLDPPRKGCDENVRQLLHIFLSLTPLTLTLNLYNPFKTLINASKNKTKYKNKTSEVRISFKNCMNLYDFIEAQNQQLYYYCYLIH